MSTRQGCVSKSTPEAGIVAMDTTRRIVALPLLSLDEEVAGIRHTFPNKIPVRVERYQTEKNLPQLDKTKFLVPQEITMSQFVTIIR